MRVRVDPGHDDQDEVIDTRACTMADVRLKTPDGREHQFTMKFGYGYPAHSAQFMFRDGNYSCDCNRRLFLAEYCGIGKRDDMENPCGDMDNPCGEIIELVSLAIRKIPVSVREGGNQ